MASVRSLGLHHPSGLRHAIEEQLLPAEPSSSSYAWDIITDENGSDSAEDELLTTKDCVVWCRGGMFRKSFSFALEKEPITQALLASFPASQDDCHSQHHLHAPPASTSRRNGSRLQKALVVLLKTQAQIFFLSGTSHVVHLPFEAEYACAGPVGIIIQRRQRAENEAPMSLKFPRVPPNSFVSSEITAFSNSPKTGFSVESLGKAKSLHFGTSSTLEKMWDVPSEQQHSRWPRLLTLTDPLSDLGLVISDPEANIRRRFSRKHEPCKRSPLNPAEEIIHIEQINLPGVKEQDIDEPLIIGITVDRDKSLYTIWSLKYLEKDDPFIGHQKKAKSKPTRRRSSMPPTSFASGTSTPMLQNFRESFGAPLPGKRQRKSDQVEKPLDLVSSLEQQDNEGAGVIRRSSRRVSSMLARADLSTSYDRNIFPDQPHVSVPGVAKRNESFGNLHGRSSSSFHQQIHPSLGSLLEAPLDWGLDEGLLNMGLDDPDFDGLQHEIRFTKIQTIALDSSNFRYPVSSQPARVQAKAFIVTSPRFAEDEYQRTQMLICIQEPLEKRLQMMTFFVKAQEKPDAMATTTPSGSGPAKYSSVSVSTGQQWKVQNVIDSSKLTDGDLSAILVLSDSKNSGKRELSAQAPWIELTNLSVSLLFVEDIRSIQYRGRVADRDVEQRKSEVIDLTTGGIVGIRHPRKRGVVDVVDGQARLHQLQIQLQPTSIQVAKVLNICKSILPDGLGFRFHAGWLHVMQWLQNRRAGISDPEWSAVTVLLLASFLNLGREEDTPMESKELPLRKRRPASASFGNFRESLDWKALELGETGSSLGCPVWMMNKGWEWALEKDLEEASPSQDEALLSPKFLTRHIHLAKDFINSPEGVTAMGMDGYVPTSLSRSSEKRRKVAADILVALHLLLDEEKLDITTPEYISPGRTDLRVLLCQIARWLKWDTFASIYELGIQEDIDSRHDMDLDLRPPIPQPPARPDIMEWIQACLAGVRGRPCLSPADIYHASSHISESEKLRDRRWDSVTARTIMFKRFFKALKPRPTAAEMVETMRDCGFSNSVLETLPEAILVPLRDAISLCQPHPSSSWTDDLLELVQRSDISLITQSDRRLQRASANILAPRHMATRDFRMLCQSVEEADGVGHDEGEGIERQAVIRLLFKDRRLNEARDLLSTHKARVARLDPEIGWTESEYLERQKELVAKIATGTLAIPAGRALLYYSLRYPLITQKLHVGGFNLNCVVKPANVTVGVDKALFTEDKVCWGFFHQGVAAGLAISPQAKGIDTSWILYNKPTEDLSNRHAGFLLALGLNGHLKGVAKWVAFKYLTPKHTMTSIGLLLGLAASYLGTMDSLITRLLSVHATRMLPRGAADLNLSPLTQTSAMLGIGLLYCNSQHRRMSEIMLSEIEHIDEEDEEEPLRSECYRLAAGFALGFINLGKGGDLRGLHDMRLTEKLIAHATATKNVEIVHILDRASAGAVMAIALIFMKSGNHIVARKIDVPSSTLQFDYIRPDVLLLRTVAKNVILWSKIEPTFSWIRDNLPAPYRSRHKLQGTRKLRSADLPFFSILTGICLSIALRYSGSASIKVRDLLLHYLDHFMRIAKIETTSDESQFVPTPPSYDEELARSNARMCQDILALSCAIVMAGTGDILVLRRLRSLHGDQGTGDADIPYGSHLATHLAIGSLFLGCGTITFGNSDLAIAALLVAFYPIFPASVMDNRSHLQAFRHFWVLATEQRCLVAKDVLTGQPVSVPVQIRTRQASSAAEHTFSRMTPCLLPSLDQIAGLSTSCGPRFWDMELDFSNKALRSAFAQTQSIYLRRRPPREGTLAATLRTLGSGSRVDNPLAWVFQLDRLQGVSYAEQAVLLDSNGQEQEVGTALDARMEMERGILDGGDRERLEGLRLLFEWGAVRDRLLEDGKAGRHHNGTDGTALHDSNDDNVWWMSDSVIESLRGQVWLAAREGEQ